MELAGASRPQLISRALDRKALSVEAWMEPDRPAGKAPRQRVSLTKLQRESAAGIELISLLQSAAADGRLSNEEIGDLRQWVESYSDAQLPARGFLSELIERILADGVVTADEQKELFKAVEKVLPVDLREDVRGRRILAEKADKELNRPLGSWNFMVAGVRHEGRPAIIAMHVSPGDQVFLARDRGNLYSDNAVGVRLANGMQIGFVPEIDAPDVAALLDAGSPQDSYVTKVLTGGRAPIPVVQATLYRPDSTKEGLARPGDVPAASGAGAAKKGCAVAALAVGTGGMTAGTLLWMWL